MTDLQNRKECLVGKFVVAHCLLETKYQMANHGTGRDPELSLHLIAPFPIQYPRVFSAVWMCDSILRACIMSFNGCSTDETMRCATVFQTMMNLLLTMSMERPLKDWFSSLLA